MSELIQRFTLNNDGGIVSVAFIPVPSGGGGGDLLAANNLSDLISASSARTNLGLGSAAITSTSAYATSAQGAKADSALQPAGSGSALTGMTKAQVGLGNVDNTSDADKPISTATQTALDGKQVAGSYATGSGSASGTNTGDNAVNALYSGLATSKQDTLVSATNIKTINGSTLLGSGNLVVSSGDPSYSPGSFTVATETWKLLGNHVKLTGAQRASVLGTGRLRVSN